MGLLDWVIRQLERSKRQKAAWHRVEAMEEDALTVFQHRCNKALIAAFKNSPELQYKQHIEGDAEKYIIGTLPQSNIKYWIYADGTQVGDYYLLDKHDFETPDAMIEAFIKIALVATQSEH